ncbi:glutathione peroxidase [Cognatishimia sp. F0-27]|uniref:glutathione peroxidase n=1 Tax=Cognatishimia sp. F0-27 TaxID=2816855 RepID=UPI001D0C113D|nr:glutathione peroxidase [Cognatishimia sp. F0-27]MCC1494092.1 glutathione peroxidase [Cognatishimia sp. F0-27]
MLRIIAFILSFLAVPALAAPSAPFANIDGGTLSLDQWAGQPVLLVNTASRCGFTDQYDGLQALYERYKDRGLVVLAVPSNDFRQELKSAEAVKEFCEVNFGLTLPMTDITKVRGPDAHPVYAWLAETVGFEPSWNFNKVLFAPDGSVVATYGSAVKPLSRALVSRIEPLLN